jgi:hypothetical protein
MTPDRLQQILDDTETRDGRRRDTHQAFADAVGHPWQQDAAAEKQEFYSSTVGKRLP